MNEISVVITEFYSSWNIYSEVHICQNLIKKEERKYKLKSFIWTEIYNFLLVSTYITSSDTANTRHVRAQVFVHEIKLNSEFILILQQEFNFLFIVKGDFVFQNEISFWKYLIKNMYVIGVLSRAKIYENQVAHLNF